LTEIQTSGLPERFVVRPRPDPVAERLGFPVNSMYTEAVLLPILGPATTLCLRRVGAWAAANPDGVELGTRQLARDLGLGESLSRNAAMSRTLTRLCQFDMAQWVDGQLAVRTAVPPLAERHLRRLSPELVKVHHWMVRRAQANRTSSVLSSFPSRQVSPEIEQSMSVEVSF
jgi:hypothetical protein